MSETLDQLVNALIEAAHQDGCETEQCNGNDISYPRTPIAHAVLIAHVAKDAEIKKLREACQAMVNIKFVVPCDAPDCPICLAAALASAALIAPQEPSK